MHKYILTCADTHPRIRKHTDMSTDTLLKKSKSQQKKMNIPFSCIQIMCAYISPKDNADISHRLCTKKTSICKYAPPFTCTHTLDKHNKHTQWHIMGYACR